MIPVSTRRTPSLQSFEVITRCLLESLQHPRKRTSDCVKSWKRRPTKFKKQLIAIVTLNYISSNNQNKSPKTTSKTLCNNLVRPTFPIRAVKLRLPVQGQQWQQDSARQQDVASLLDAPSATNMSNGNRAIEMLLLDEQLK